MALWLRRLLGGAAYAALGLLLLALWSHREAALALVGDASPGLLAGSLVLLVALFFLDALGWMLILRTLGERRPGLGHGVWIWMASSVSRYLPGGFWPYASRVGLAHDAGVRMGAAALSLVLETVLLAVSALAIGFPALLLLGGGTVPPWLAPVSLAGGLVLLHPRVVAIGRHLPGWAGRAFAEIRPVPYNRMLRLLAYYLVFWSLFGAAFLLFAGSLGMALDPVEGTSAFVLAFLAGFLALFAPGGLGVREGAMYLLLEPQLGAGAALTLSVGSRLWLMAGEAASLGLAALFRGLDGAARPKG